MQHGRPGHRYATSQTWEFTLSDSMASMPANTLCTLSEAPTGTSPDAFSTSGASVASRSFGSNEGTTGESNSSSNVTGGFIDKFKQLIFAKFGKIAELVGINGGDESESNGENGSYGTGENGVGSTGGTGYAGTGDWRNVIDVDPGEPNKKQRALVDKMKSIAGTLKYSMSGPRNPDAGSADCSSTVNWAYNKILGANVGGTTPAIMQSSNLSTVDMSDLPETGGTGSGPNLKKLQLGDLVLLSRPTSGFTSGRPFRVGHVEMYMGDGKTIGHGSNGGPRERQIESDKYIMARRFNDFIPLDAVYAKKNENSIRNRGYSSSMDGYNSNISSTKSNTVDTSGSLRDRGYSSSMDGYNASGSGLTYNIAQDGINTIRRSHKSSKSAFGGASGIYNLSKFSKYRKSKYYKDLRGGASLTGDQNDKEILIAMIKGIITLLSNVSANSDKIGDIVTAIGDINSSNSQNFKTSVNAVKNDLGVSDTDETIAQMQQLLNNLAAG